MMTARRRVRRVRVRGRRGAALVITMFFTMAVAAMAASAIYLNGGAGLIARSYDREDQLKYAAEAALAIGKARLNYDPTALPDSGYAILLSDAVVPAADSQSAPGVLVSVYAGLTGSTTGQFGKYASVVAQVRDAQGNGLVRRLELAQESFAKFAYWSNSETNNGSTIYFANNDQLWGPVWSNGDISINTTGATFHADVATAGVINGTANGHFLKGYRIRQKTIPLPSLSTLSRLQGYAAAGGFSLNPPTSGNETTVRTRIEFVAVDLNNDGDSTDVDEGFFKVYTVNGGKTSWLRADGTASGLNCGDWHAVGGRSKFFPAAIHRQTWFRDLLALPVASGGGGLTTAAANAERDATTQTIMQHAGARCYLGGDPHLAAVERTPALYPLAADRQKGGEDTTFTRSDSLGTWQLFTNSPNAAISARRPYDAGYLFPMYRGFNANVKGVIYAAGTVGVSGVLRGRMTLYSPNTVVLLDDMRYATDRSSSDLSKGACPDILGIIGGANIVVADNTLNTPQNVGATPQTNLDDTKDAYIHSVLMAPGTSFGVERYNGGPTDANDCEGTNVGRGCLYITGGVIQDSRGAVGTGSGSGFVKRYSYDRCAVTSPPPYFPTTGRYIDNRYYELDRVGFNVGQLFERLTPR